MSPTNDIAGSVSPGGSLRPKGVKQAKRETRPLLASPATLAEALSAIDAAQQIVVLAGAGISVSCGVPDFRSADGVYAIANQMGLALSDPQELFDLAFFDDDPQPFYSFASRLWPRPGSIEPGGKRNTPLPARCDRPVTLFVNP